MEEIDFKWERVSGEREYFEFDNICCSFSKNGDSYFVSLYTITQSIVLTSQFFKKDVKQICEKLFKLFYEIIQENKNIGLEWEDLKKNTKVYCGDERFNCILLDEQECTFINETGKILRIHLENKNHISFLNNLINKFSEQYETFRQKE